MIEKAASSSPDVVKKAGCENDRIPFRVFYTLDTGGSTIIRASHDGEALERFLVTKGLYRITKIQELDNGYNVVREWSNEAMRTPLLKKLIAKLRRKKRNQRTDKIRHERSA